MLLIQLVARLTIFKHRVSAMPNKYPNKKGWNIQKYEVNHWREYNNALKNRGNIDEATLTRTIKLH